MKSAVLFLVFNRPKTALRVFKAIRAAKPSRLYVAADGPRNGRQEEAALCAEARRIVEHVDWPCEIKTRFREKNLGCKHAVVDAITWFFEHEEQGIILEDDCLPTPSFFPYCDELLEKYRHDSRVWEICGTDILESARGEETPESYLFSACGITWGWASWRRAWKHFDPDLKEWLEMSTPERLNYAFLDPERRIFTKYGKAIYRGTLKTCWDYQWEIIRKYNHALTIIPHGNMVVNIGFGEGATHTTDDNGDSPKKMYDIHFPLRHPKFMLPDGRHDKLWLSRFHIKQFRREIIRRRTAQLLGPAKRLFNFVTRLSHR